MKISADCIEEELETNEQQLSETFPKMDLNSNNAEMNETKEGLNGSEVRVIYRYCSPNESHSIEKDGFISLTVIPIIDNNFHDGYYSNWDEVKNQVLNLNFKDRNKVPKTLSFVGKIGSGNCELTLITKEDYFTALKSAELCGQPLDVMIRTSVPVQEKVVENNGFVVLGNTPNVNNDKTVDSCAQIGSDDKNSFITDDQIEGLKRDITIDVTKRIISKLNECLLDLNVCNNSSISLKSDIKPNSRDESLVNNDLNSSSVNSNTQVIHYGIICYNCESQIKGIRYKCSVCLDFDLCEKCETLPNIHNETHFFLKIKQYIKQFEIPNEGKDISIAMDSPKEKITNSVDFELISKPKSVRLNQTNEQTLKHPIANSSTNSKASNVPNDEVIKSISSDPMKKRMSEQGLLMIAQNLHDLNRFKGQIHEKSSQTSEERSSCYESKASTSAAHNPQPISSNKTLFLSGIVLNDETIPSGTRIPPLTQFRKTWKVRNTGTKVWTRSTTLRYIWGHSELEPFDKVTEVEAPQLRPGQEGSVSIRFNAPKSSSLDSYQSHWRLHHRGQPFGQRLICIVIIDPKATQPSKASANTQTISNIKDKNIMQSIRVPTLKTINPDLIDSKAQTLPKPNGLNKQFQALEKDKQKSLKTSNDEKILNIPFNISANKSEKQNSMTRMESNLNKGTNNNSVKNKDKLNEAEEDSMSDLSLSSSQLSQQFVCVPFPKCFDLNVPFSHI